MSPALTEQVVVTLTPERAQILRFGRGWRPPLLASETVNVEAMHYQDSDALARTLSPLMAKCNPKAAPVQALLSDQFFNFAVLPGDREVVRSQDQQALARIVFERQFGTLAQHWELQWSPEGLGEPMLACGIDRTLLETLRQALGTKTRLRALRPVLMSIVNHHRYVLERRTACLAIFEHARMTLVWISKGHWQMAMGRSISPADPDAPARVFAEQLALQHVGSPGTVWVCNLNGTPPGKLHPEWKMRSLPRPEIDPAVQDNLVVWGLR